MTTFTIDRDLNISAFANDQQVQANIPPSGYDAIFSTEKELAKQSAGWPITQFADIWNSFAGQVPFDSLKPVKKFTDRKTAINRIWKVVQALTPAVAAQVAPAAPKKAMTAKAPSKKDAPPTAREGSKKAIVLEMLKRPGGASLSEIMSATSWQVHSVRGFISGGLGKKMGLTVESFKRSEGERCYKLAQ